MLLMIYLFYLWFTYDSLMIHLWNLQGVCLLYLGKIPLTYYTYDYLWLLIVLMLLMLLMHTYLHSTGYFDKVTLNRRDRPYCNLQHPYYRAYKTPKRAAHFRLSWRSLRLEERRWWRQSMVVHQQHCLQVGHQPVVLNELLGNMVVHCGIVPLR